MAEKLSEINQRINESLAPNADAFSKQLDRLAIYIGKNVELAIKKTCFDLYSKIVEESPFLTGRARANWNISVNDGEETHDRTDWQGRMKEVADNFSHEVIGNEVIIYNNLEYIGPLEDGSSQQKPNGWIAVALSEFEQLLNQNLKRFEELEEI